MVTAHRTMESIPQVPGWPVLGQLPDFRFARLRVFADAAALGPMARIRLGPFPVLVLTAAGLAREVLVDNADAFVKSRTLARFARRLLGNGLITSEYEFHRRQRKLMAPLFSPRVISVWADDMVRAADATVDHWAQGQEIDVADEMMALTLRIVGRTILDVDISADAEWVGRELSVANHMASAETGRLIRLPMEVPTPGRRRNQAAIARVDSLITKLIAERRAASAAGHGGTDALSLLVDARDEDDGRAMTDREVRDEVMTLFFAGHETTSNLLSWTLLLLAQHPEVRAELETEVDSALRDGPATSERLASLPLAMRVLKESMRLYPPVYGIGREAIRDITIGGVQVPAGHTLAINVYGMHRRPDLFPDPERFDPDRWLPEREEVLPRSAYMPFGSGPRICIGNHFALMEAHLLLATMARRASLELSGPAPRGRPLITWTPEKLPMMVQRRDR